MKITLSKIKLKTIYSHRKTIAKKNQLVLCLFAHILGYQNSGMSLCVCVVMQARDDCHDTVHHVLHPSAPNIDGYFSCWVKDFLLPVFQCQSFRSDSTTQKSVENHSFFLTVRQIFVFMCALVRACVHACACVLGD